MVSQLSLNSKKVKKALHQLVEWANKLEGVQINNNKSVILTLAWLNEFKRIH